MKDIKQLLLKIGLTKGESEVYITLLSLGNTTSGNIIKKSKVSRSKVYDVLERLQQKGLVSKITKENIQHFQATDPSKILEYLHSKKHDIENNIQDAEKIVPEIKKIQQTTENQDARVYSGIQGLQSFYNWILEEGNTGEKYYAITIGSMKWTTDIKTFFSNFHVKREEKGITAKILFSGKKSELAKATKIAHSKLYELRHTTQKAPSGILIFRDYVGILNWQETPQLFVVQSKSNAEQFKQFFNELYNNATTVK